MTKWKSDFSNNMHSMMLKYLQIRRVETECSAAWLTWRFQLNGSRAVTSRGGHLGISNC